MQRTHRHAPHPPTAVTEQSSGPTSAAVSNQQVNEQCQGQGPTLTPPKGWLTPEFREQMRGWRTGPNPLDLEGYSHDGHTHSANPLTRRPHAAPRQAGPQHRAHDGVQIHGDGVSPDAMSQASAVSAAVFGYSPEIQERLRAADVRMVVVPSTQGLPDVEGFESLVNTCTADGSRSWHDVRGSGGTPTNYDPTDEANEWLVSMPEEGLVEVTDGSPWALNEAYTGYGANHSVAVHEAAHILHHQGLSDEQREQILSMYTARKTTNKQFMSDYAASNVDEYFAEAVNAYLGVNNQIGTLRGDELAEHAPDWLTEHDVEMKRFLSGVLGTQEQAFDRARVHSGGHGAEAQVTAPPQS